MDFWETKWHQFWPKLQWLTVAPTISALLDYSSYWIEYTPFGSVKFEDHVKNLANIDWELGNPCWTAGSQWCHQCIGNHSLLNTSYILRWEKRAVPRHNSRIKLPNIDIMPDLNFRLHQTISFFNCNDYQCDYLKWKVKYSSPSTHC